MIKKITFWVVLFLFPLLAGATHIVGGVLNYTHGSGNVYTVTLKLYRDCGANTSAFPANVTISIRGASGATFSPSKDLTMSLGTVSSVSSAINPCGVPPNPVPCVQQGIYTATISLPALTGGYHLYYQTGTRNPSLVNVSAGCNCVGQSFYAYVPDNTVNSNSNSNPVFSSMPPLYLCVGRTFSISQAATDANGDSLAYSFYTPLNGDNGTGPLDPTFSGSTASFSPVSFNTGYSSNSPLGGSGVSLNPLTGVISGTVSTTGAFVVGIRVREYRNGTLIGETLREFQYTVLSCPQSPPSLAISNFTLNYGCPRQITAQGINAGSATWKSVYPGTLGAYNSYLSCTSNCLKPTIVSTGTPPAYVDYVVCGLSTNCINGTVCDTFRVTFNPPLTVSIAPSNPALCNGQTSTTLIATGSGGTPPYSYLWNNVNPSQTITVGAGTYNVKITDASGCQPSYNSVVVVAYTVPVTVNAGADKTRCIANPAASLTATITGATGGIWSGGTGTFSPNNTTTSNMFYTPSAAELSAGSSTLFITTTGNGMCPADKDTIVIFYTGFTGTVATTATQVSCFGGSNGSASVSVTGGMAPHTYTWNVSPVQTGAAAVSLSAGVYPVTITNSLGCTTQATVSVTQPPALAFSSSVSNASCAGGANGKLGLLVSGGTAPYSYTWSAGAQNTASITGLAAGTYTANIRDARNCAVTATLTVTQPASLTIASNQTNVACYNALTGAIGTTVSGGTAPYSCTWSPGGSSAPQAVALGAGSYTVSVSDNLGCTATKTVSITQPTQLTVTTTFTNETCSYLDNAAASALAGGGTPGYTYNWTPGSFTTSSIANLAAGAYTLLLTDANSCSVSTVVTVSQPPVLSVSFLNLNGVSCAGGTNGSVTAAASGGSPGYTYLWQPGGNTSATLAGMPAGTYSLQVSDTKSCVAGSTVTIVQPPALTFSSATSSVTCYGGNNGSAGVTAVGGSTPYAFFWLPGGQTTASVSALVAGTYTSIITDANGCTGTGVHLITQASSLSVAFTATPVSCFNGNNGAISASVTGGTPAYAYTWTPFGNLASVSTLTAGTYTLNVTDANGCLLTQTTAVSEPPVLSITGTFTNETCDYADNGSAGVLVSGGTPGYTYLWQPGSATTAVVFSLTAGGYSVTATDQNGCTIGTSITITQPASLSITTISVTPVSCFGNSDGSANIQASGGTPNYSYTWAPGGTNSTLLNNVTAGVYTVTVSDSHSCLAVASLSVTQPASLTLSDTIVHVSCNSGSNGALALIPAGGNAPYSYFWLPLGQTTASISGLSAGSYTGTVTDSKNCVAGRTFTITEPTPVAIAFTVTDVSCYQGTDGTIQSLASGGNAPYTYSWVNGPSTQSISGITAGTYTLTVTDNNGCVLSQTVAVAEPPALTIALSGTDETCDYLNNGTAVVNASGGTPGYTFLWLPGNSTSDTLTGLSSGAYTVTATDLNGCFVSSVITISEPAPLSVAFSFSSDISCFGGSDGMVVAQPSGGTPNYSYTWSPGTATAAMVNSLVAGTYTVRVADNNGCVADNTITLTEPTPLALVPTISNVLCNGSNNGAISISTSGGSGPYAHVIMPGNIQGANFSNLSPGTYSINTTDANGCLLTTTLAITQPVSMSTNLSYTNSSCMQQNGRASISVSSGGVPPFTYTWLPSGGSSSISTSLYAGSYTVTVSDSSGCSSSKLVNINDNTAPVVSIVSTTNVSCFGGSDGALTASHTPAAAPYTYSWSPQGGTALSAVNLPSGIYVLKVTDNTGCVGFATSTLVAQPGQVVIGVSSLPVSCFGGTDGIATASVSGGVAAYSYTWQTGTASGSTVTGLAAGMYTLLVTDANNCAQTASFAVTQPTAPVTLALTSWSVSCAGGANGTITALASGGTFPYNYNLDPGSISGQTVSALTAGIYTVTATDANGCIDTATVPVDEPAALSLLSSDQNSDCGLANGQATVNASGGVGGYSYQWAPAGGTGSSANGLPSGTYTVTVTDSNSCTAITSLTISDNPPPQVSVISTSNVSCFGGTNGAATASVSGGIAPFTYSWLPAGGTGSTGTGFSSGTYTVIVTSANNCTALAVSPVITQPTQVFASTATTAVSCFGGADGSASVSAFGGTPGYTYSWPASTATASSISGLSAGSYTMQITDANSCVRSVTYNITEPAAPLNLSLSSTSVSCANGGDGSVGSTATGGTAPYSFTLSPGNFSGPSYSNLGAGVYTVFAIDAKGCATQETVAVLNAAPIILSLTTENSNCSLANGQATVLASGGAGGFSYLWSPAGGTSSVTSGIAAGAYSVTVTDANTCTAVGTATVTDLPSHTAAISSVTNVSCYNGSDGSASVSVSGGTGPFTFTWSPVGGNTVTASGLSSGTYTVLVTSANGCTASAVTPFISQPSQIFVNLALTPVSCFGGSNGSASASAFGGTGAYSYSWQSGAATGSVNSGLGAGIYTMQVTDANNCPRTATFTITQPAAPLSLAMTSGSVSCFGGSNGSALGTASGGTSPYFYNWSPSGGSAAQAFSLSVGVYTLTTTDNKGCSTASAVTVIQPAQPVTATASSSDVSCFGGANGTATLSPSGGLPGYTYTWTPSGGNGQTATGLSAGSYTVAIADLNSCPGSVVVLISEPSMLTSSLVIKNPSCGFANGKLSSQVSGGTSPYSYSWSSSTVTTSFADSLAAGAYTLTVTDGKGCQSKSAATLTNIPGPTATISSFTNVSCHGGNNGSASVSISQGTQPYTIQWLPSGGSSVIANALSAGSYSANITDSLGCRFTATATIAEPSQLSIATTSVQHVSCNGGNDGAVSVTALGGTPAYTYSWSTAQTGSLISQLQAGNYVVTASDFNGCKHAILIQISDPPVLSSTVTAMHVLCFSGTGGASVTVSGGTAPYSYSWSASPAQSGNILTQVPAGTYSVLITDNKGCTQTKSVSVTEPSQVVTSVTQPDTLCAGKPASLVASASGGSGGYYYSWMPGAVSNSGTLNITPQTAMVYTVLAFDKNGCSGQDALSTVNLFDFEKSNLELSGNTLICPGQTSLLEATVTGNTGSLSYAWNNNLAPHKGIHAVSPAKTTTYVVTVTNACGKSVKDTIIVNLSTPPVIKITADTLRTCIPGTVRFSDLSGSSASNDPIVSWFWDFGDGSGSGEQHPAHLYTMQGVFPVQLSVVTDRGCTNKTAAPLIVRSNPQPVAAFTLNTETLDLPYDVLKCTNQSTGAVSYNWNFGDGKSSNLKDPQVLLETVGVVQVQLIATSAYGCKDTTEKFVLANADVIFPTAFTPNEEASSGGSYNISSLSNDVFFPYTSGVLNYSLQIFNRWGELIFESNDVKKGWDGYYRGTICQIGTYVWKANINLENGNTFNKSGTVTIIR